MENRVAFRGDLSGHRNVLGYESFLGTKKRLVLLPKGAGSFVSNPIFEYRVKVNFCYVTYRATAVLRSRL